jgi:hypothetical protein
MIENFIPKSQKTGCFETYRFGSSFGALFEAFLPFSSSLQSFFQKQKFLEL